jgi:EAL domain-containing protein (putative c-di-GMP-specific phosphodiesterase class I)
MYQAKAIGRSNFQWFDNAMLQATEEKLALGLALGHAIKRNELTVHYQPEVSISDRHVVGMEALVRWSNPMRGEIEPDRFVPIAEESGLILTLGEWVLRKACRECVEIQRELKRMVSVAVNVSPRQFQQNEWIATLVNAIAESRIAPSCLELEITEGMLMENPEESARKLHQIRKLGVKIVVDDFGTGYSSLSYLTRFPIDKIKIDRSFVRDLATDAADAAVINAIIALAKSLNIRVIAEGVETEQQHRYMFERGCDEAQGFLYGAAVSSTAFAEAVSCIERS